MLVEILATAAHADSPLTSVDLSTGYDDLPAVREARARHLDGAVLAALTGDAPIAEKAAVVSALGWNVDGKHDAAVLANALAVARHAPATGLTLDQLTPADRLVLGYLLALDDYFALEPLRPDGQGLWGATPVGLVDSGADALKDDFAAQVVRSLVHAQADMATSWCAVYQDEQRVIAAFPPARRDMRPAAVTAYTDYLGMYASDCR